MEINYTNPKLLDLLPNLSKKTSNVCLLNSTGGGWDQLLAYNPSEKFIVEAQEQLEPHKLYSFIEESQQQNRIILGYFGYDNGFDLLNIRQKKTDPLNLPKIYLLAYENYARIENKQIIYYGHKPELNDSPPDRIENIKFEPEISENDYGEMFDRAIEFIKTGHIYQVNLSHQLKARSRSEPRLIYKKLADKNKGAMMAYLEGDGFELLSVSPERFIKIEGKKIFTTPIKGTVEKESSKSENKLLASKKEESELSMITDLLRNDLSKVCEEKTVVLEKHRDIHNLTSLLHTYSKISGTLKPDISPAEAFMSMFPGGSITGCPKKRAIEIIDELEPIARGAYCGSFVCFTPDNRFDSNILIRTIFKKGDDLTLQVGGGIVFDSDKTQEYQETLAKARPIVKALESS